MTSNLLFNLRGLENEIEVGAPDLNPGPTKGTVAPGHSGCTLFVSLSSGALLHPVALHDVRNVQIVTQLLDMVQQRAFQGSEGFFLLRMGKILDDRISRALCPVNVLTCFHGGAYTSGRKGKVLGPSSSHQGTNTKLPCDVAFWSWGVRILWLLSKVLHTCLTLHHHVFSRAELN